VDRRRRRRGPATSTLRRHRAGVGRSEKPTRMCPSALLANAHTIHVDGVQARTLPSMAIDRSRMVEPAATWRTQATSGCAVVRCRRRPAPAPAQRSGPGSRAQRSAPCGKRTQLPDMALRPPSGRLGPRTAADGCGRSALTLAVWRSGRATALPERLRGVRGGPQSSICKGQRPVGSAANDHERP
jgi:hypothetical protein